MKKILKGKIIGLKSKNTATVLVTRTKLHPIYKKKYKINKKYQSHYSDIELSLDDSVIIQENQPVSKTKKWLVIKIPASPAGRKDPLDFLRLRSGQAARGKQKPQPKADEPLAQKIKTQIKK